VSAGAVWVEKLLSQIQSERQEIATLFEKAREAHVDARKVRDRLKSELAAMRRDRELVLQEAREEAAQIVRELRTRLRQLESEARPGGNRKEHRQLTAKLDEVLKDTAAELGGVPESPEAGSLTPLAIKPGVTVNVPSLEQQGTVVSVAAGEAEVQIGAFTMRLPIEDLEVVRGSDKRQERAVEFESTRAAPAMQIDLRGWRADDALMELDQYLHDNYMHGQGTVRIVHGKGTGALRKAIREQLSGHPLVKSIEAEEPRQGGEGVTVVRLVV
jgi:DNA mismatch repair protein MutS2